jgi:hypothetical protein
MSAKIGPLLNYTMITIETVVNLKRVKVHFVVDFGAIIHTATQSPYSMPWAPPGMGRHLLLITVHRRRFRRRRIVTCKVIGLIVINSGTRAPVKAPTAPVRAPLTPTVPKAPTAPSSPTAPKTAPIIATAPATPAPPKAPAAPSPMAPVAPMTSPTVPVVVLPPVSFPVGANCGVGTRHGAMECHIEFGSGTNGSADIDTIGTRCCCNSGPATSIAHGTHTPLCPHDSCSARGDTASGSHCSRGS